VLPLAAHSFLVGLLVIEQIALVPHLPSGNSAVVVRHWQQDESVEEALGNTYVRKSLTHAISLLNIL